MAIRNYVKRDYNIYGIVCSVFECDSIHEQAPCYSCYPVTYPRETVTLHMRDARQNNPL